MCYCPDICDYDACRHCTKNAKNVHLTSIEEYYFHQILVAMS